MLASWRLRTNLQGTDAASERRSNDDGQAAIRSTFERNAQIVMARPAVAQKTYVTRVHIRDGLTCDIEEGPWTLTADLSTTQSRLPQ